MKANRWEVPLTLYKQAKEAIAEYSKLYTEVKLNTREGRWYATLVVEHEGQQAPNEKNRLSAWTLA